MYMGVNIPQHLQQQQQQQQQQQITSVYDQQIPSASSYSSSSYPPLNHLQYPANPSLHPQSKFVVAFFSAV